MFKFNWNVMEKRRFDLLIQVGLFVAAMLLLLIFKDF